jgi:autotransporter translocation and assembly factor TamB
LTGEGFLPMNLGLNNTGKILYDDRPIRIQAATSGIETGIDLAFLQTLTSRVKQVKGTLVFDLKLENTLKAPRANGAMRVIDGAFAVPEYGVVYNDVQLVASIDSTNVEINDFHVQSDKGSLKAKSQLKYAKGAVSEANGSLTATDFLVLRTRDMEVRLDAEINGVSNAQGARYRGDITIDRSRFFLPALQQRSVIQLEETGAARSTPADSAKPAAKPDAGAPLAGWLKNLRGEIKIKIPRNTWIRGPELNAEIEGALDFNQEGAQQFSLFGPLNIIRGNYELFGKRFDISSGQIIFQGDPYSPQFALEAKHVFRAPGGDREKKSVEVKISGSLTNPQIQFLRGGEPLDEKNALANLLFGVDFDQLFYSQGKEIETELGKSGDNYAAAAAKGLISGLVSHELAKSLGRSLNLDVIEFQGAGDFSQTSVLVGKYITNDLFISFGQEPEGRVVSLELELFKFLFLQAAHGGEENRKTGFDFIWKVDW